MSIDREPASSDGGLGGFRWDDTPPRRRLRPHSLFLRLLVTVTALTVVATTGFAYLIQRAAEDNVTVLPATLLDGLSARPVAAVRQGERAAVTTLLIGTDDGVAKTPGDIPGTLADTVMMIRLSPARDRVDVLAIPRDAVVPIPGHADDRINSTLALGGVPLVVQTVEALTAVRMDHVMVMDFDAVREVTTALGGVTVVNPVATTDTQTGERFAAGPVVLRGDRAISWVRQRANLPNGDLDRIVNQQRLMAAIGVSIADRATSSPATLRRVVDIISTHLSVGPSLNFTSLTELVTELVSTPRDRIEFYTAPVAATRPSPDGHPVVELDRTRLTEAAKAIATDQPVALVPTPILGS